MGNVLNESKQQQVLALGRLGWSLRKIERATGVRRETAAGYLARAGLRRSGDSNPASGVTTDFGAGIGAPPPPQSGKDSGSASACAAWHELISDHGFAGGYQSVKRFVQRLRSPGATEARVVIETRAGEEAQVDYGTGPMVRDSATGKYRRTRLFVLTLAHSRKSVRLLVFRSSTRVWAELHEQAFRRLGGAPRVVVLDNLKEGVLAPDFYDPGSDMFRWHELPLAPESARFSPS